MQPVVDWPNRVFRSPLLKRLDERGRRDLARSGKLIRLAEGEELYRVGDPSDALYVVVEGSIELGIVPRGDDVETALRTCRAGDSFGEEAVVPGARRGTRAVARASAEVAEVPFSVLNRVVVRGGGGEFITREMARLRRAVTRDLLAGQAFARGLPDADLELLLDAVRYQSFEPGEEIYRAGQAAGDCFLLQHGLVQVQREEAGRVSVRAYLSAGDLFGDEALSPAANYRYSAVANSQVHCMRVADDVMRTVADRNPGLTDRALRLRGEREADQRVLVPSPSGATQHVLKDVYRMQMARSLLAIDQDHCVRCGHCAWACADLHDGVTRLVRRGDKVLAQRTGRAEAPSSLLLPNTCQHCENPACMVDCPTGAIGRDPEGEVFIREELCTGCGACAKACPWENIQMASRPKASGAPLDAAPLLAVKCDLCRDYEGPACVQVCPVDAIQRLDPSRDFAEVQQLFGQRTTKQPDAATRPRRFGMGPALGVLAAVVLAEQLMPARFETFANRLSALSGWLGAAGCLFLVSYAALKRGQRYWLEKRSKRRAASARAHPNQPVASRVRPWLDAHVAVGWLTLAAVIVHGGVTLRGDLAGVLSLAFVSMVGSGVWLIFAFRQLPARLSRLESKGALPEDLKAEQSELEDRLYQLTTGRDRFTKKVVEVLLLPYARSRLQSVRLLFSGRSLAAERKRLENRVQELTEGRAGSRVESLTDLIKTVVDLRALPVRRVLSASLRGLAPVHAGLSVTFLVLLLVHVLESLR